MATKILLLEDDRLYNETLQDFLSEEGFNVLGVFDPRSALDEIYNGSFDLYLLDINLPFESGIELLGELRDSGDNTPAIFLTSRDDKASLRDGFLSGADDYMQKPIDLDELSLRINAVLGRSYAKESIKLGRFILDAESKTLIDEHSKRVNIGKKSIDLLLLLVQSQDRILSNDTIKSRLWLPSEEPSNGAIRVYINKLKKLFPNAIENIRGIGYKFDLQGVDPSEQK